VELLELPPINLFKRILRMMDLIEDLVLVNKFHGKVIGEVLLKKIITKSNKARAFQVNFER
jgi:hypothetical protein